MSEALYVVHSFRDALPESWIDAFARAIMDPNNPDNLLKRPVRATCEHCGQPYVRRLQIQVPDARFCSPECMEADRVKWAEILADLSILSCKERP